MLKHADVGGTGQLDRSELFACVVHWYFHVPPIPVAHKHGVTLMLPWMLAFLTGLGCAWMTASISVLWSEAKTQEWLLATVLSLLWKMFLIDPVKAVFCGAALEPIATILFGGGNIIDGAANSMLEELDGQIESLADDLTDILVDGVRYRPPPVKIHG